MSIAADMGTASRSSSCHGEHITSVRGTPGILVFSPSLQLQYVNRRALDMMRNVGKAMTIGGVIVLPAQLRQLCAQAQARLAECPDGGDVEPFEMTQTITETGPRLFLRLLGYPAGVTGTQSRIILIIEEVEPHEEHNALAGTPGCERQIVGAGLFTIPLGNG